MTNTTTVHSAPAMATDKRGIPVTIITGFLGSGKTTLLNHILSNQEGIKTAVLVNEFGEIGIDNELLITTGDDMVELSNGCICCTINNDLVNAVYKVLERPEKVDYLVVETTGLADPLPVAMTFLGTDLRDMTRLDSIVTVVDAANFSLDLFNSQAAENQIAYADIILLNKTDLVDEADADLLEVRVRDMRPGARLLRSVKGHVPLPLILSVGLFETDQYYNPAAKEGEVHKHDDHGHDDHGHAHHDHDHPDHDHHDHGHDHADHSACDHDHGHCEHDDHDHHGHDHHDHAHQTSDHLAVDGFTSLSFESDRPFSVKRFQHFLDEQMPTNVFRAKGILWFDESPKRHVFHLSGKRFSLDDDEWRGAPKNQLVLIGQNLEHDKLRSQIESCLTIASTHRGKGFGK